MRAVATILSAAFTRRRDEQRVRHEALHDPLTGLANRTLLRDRLELALARSERERRPTAVLFIDLDNFQEVNDTHGHTAGDELLVQIAGRLQRALRPADTIARLGGDEFVCVCEAADEQSALALGRRLGRTIGLPVIVDGTGHRPSASIGISLGYDDPDALLNDADAAVYHAKARASNSSNRRQTANPPARPTTQISPSDRRAPDTPNAATPNSASPRQTGCSTPFTPIPDHRLPTSLPGSAISQLVSTAMP